MLQALANISLMRYLKAVPKRMILLQVELPWLYLPCLMAPMPQCYGVRAFLNSQKLIIVHF